MAEENSIKMKKEPTIWENILANNTSDKDLISKKTIVILNIVFFKARGITQYKKKSFIM